MEENNYLVESFGNSIGSDIAELTAEAAEFTFDACSGEDSILKEVPFVGTAVKLYSIGSKVHDKHSFYKLKSFITAVNTGTVDPGELDERRRKFLSNAKFRKQELEFLLILIERYVGFEKPNMLGKLYVAYIDGTINWNELAMYAEVVDRFLPGDWNLLDEYRLSLFTPESIDIDRVQRLISMGLVTESIEKCQLIHNLVSNNSVMDCSIMCMEILMVLFYECGINLERANRNFDISDPFSKTLGKTESTFDTLPAGLAKISTLYASNTTCSGGGRYYKYDRQADTSYINASTLLGRIIGGYRVLIGCSEDYWQEQRNSWFVPSEEKSFWEDHIKKFWSMLQIIN